MTMWSPEMSEEGPFALSITRALESDIRGGRLRPGDQLPTHRALAESLGVNVGTVSRAYAEARRRGVIRGEVGRGTFVAAPGEPILAPRGDGEVVDLTINVPQLHPRPDLPDALRQLADAPELDAIVSYRDPAGSPRTREAGVTWLRSLGVDTEADRVAVCAGAQHGVLVAIASVVGPGELVLSESLTYPGFQACARMLGLRVQPVEMDEEGILPESLEAICAAERPRLLYCMPTLQNPTGAQMGAARRERVCEIARAHDLTLVQDEVHGGIVDDPAPSLAALAPERVITVAGVSKILLPGLRIAYVAGPPERATAFPELVWSSIWMASPLGAELAARWIEDGSAERVRAARRQDMDARHAIAARALGGVEYRTQPGAYHLWLPLPRPWDAASFAAASLERGVAVTPADAFAVSPALPPSAVRVSLTGCQDPALLEESLGRIAELLAERPAPPSVRL